MPIESPKRRQFPKPRSRYESVASLYERVLPTVQGNEQGMRDEVYVSLPLNSGGAKRLFTIPKEARDVAKMYEQIRRLNMQFANVFLDVAGHTISQELVTVPPDIGPRTGWGETQYNMFWLLFITGVVEDWFPSLFENVVKKSGIAEGIDDHTLRREERAGLYEKLLDLFGDLYVQLKPERAQVSGMILLPDHDVSFGCTLESSLAARLGISTYEVFFDPNHVSFPAIASAAIWLLAESGEKYLRTGDGTQPVIYSPYRK